MVFAVYVFDCIYIYWLNCIWTCIQIHDVDSFTLYTFELKRVQTTIPCPLFPFHRFDHNDHIIHTTSAQFLRIQKGIHFPLHSTHRFYECAHCIVFVIVLFDDLLCSFSCAPLFFAIHDNTAFVGKFNYYFGICMLWRGYFLFRTQLTVEHCTQRDANVFSNETKLRAPDKGTFEKI